MKVLFISTWYPTLDNGLKGIFIKKHAHAVKSAGVDIEVLALTINNSEKIFEKKFNTFTDEAGVKTHLIEINSRFYKFYYVNLFYQFRLLKKYYKEVSQNFKPKLVHSNVLFPAGILGYWLSKKEKLPHIITEHWSQVPKFMKKSLWSGAGKKAYNTASKISAVSEFLKNRISPFVEEPKKISVIPNVVDSDHFFYKEKDRSEETLVFSCVAHWKFPKRPDLIFEGLKSLSGKTKKKIELNVIGEGVLLDALKTQTWLFKVNYLGNLAHPELAKILQGSDYFLHASSIETFSIVIAEALATGTPVLATHAGAIPELIKKSNGITCENTPESWAEGLVRLINSSWSNTEIAKGAERFTKKNIGLMFSSVYSDRR